MAGTNRKPHSQLGAYLALFSGLIALGFSAIFVRLADVPGSVASFYRMAIGLLSLTIPFLYHRRGKPVPSWNVARIALLGGVFFAIDLIFWATGVVLSGATNPTLMSNTAPLWVGLGSLLIFQERLPGRFWIGLLVAMSGAVLVLGIDALKSFDLGLGTLFGLIAGIFYGGYFLITQRGRRELDAITYFWFSALGAVIVIFVINLVLGNPLLGYSNRSYLALIGLGVISQGLGWLAINYAQGHLPATVVSPTLLGQPVLTGLIAGPLLGEFLEPLQIAGGLAVLAGVYLVHRSRIARVGRQSRSRQG
ncbi:MAG: DMT family transporter [Anaerolineales bacterium]